MLPKRLRRLNFVVSLSKAVSILDILPTTLDLWINPIIYIDAQYNVTMYYAVLCISNNKNNYIAYTHFVRKKSS